MAVGDHHIGIKANPMFCSVPGFGSRDTGCGEALPYRASREGAIALGHPFGMSGARITGTAALELRERGAP